MSAVKSAVEVVSEPQPIPAPLAEFIEKLLERTELYLATAEDGPAQRDLLSQHRLALSLLRGEALSMHGLKLSISLPSKP